MMMRRWTAISNALWPAVLLMGVGLVLTANRAQALNVHSIRIGAYGTAEAAEAARVKVAETCSPAFVREDKSLGETPYALLVGHFPYYAEAWVCAKKLKDQGTYPACAVVTWEWDGRDLEQSRLPIALPFNTQGLEGAQVTNPEAHWVAVGLAGQPEPEASLLSKSPGEMTRDELLAVGLRASDKTLAIPALRQFLVAYPTAPELNRVRLRLARLTGCGGTDDAYALVEAVRSSGSSEEKSLADLVWAYMATCRGRRAEAMTAFVAMANNAALPPSLRLDAMQRYARHAHALRDYPTAWLAFEQIEKTAPNAATAADARMERSGFAFELVDWDRGAVKASWDDARRLCQSVDQIPGAPAEPRATARLMFAETFFKEKNYDRVIEEADKLVADFPSVARERVTGLFWKARALEELHRADEALSVYAAIDADSITADKLFPALNVKAKGLFHASRLYRLQGNDTAARVAGGKLLQLYPDSSEAQDYRIGTSASGS